MHNPNETSHHFLSNNSKNVFHQFSVKVSNSMGSPWAFILVCLTIVAWAITGPFFHYSDAWQLVINTGTTIVTFLMVFLIQNTQNRDAKAIHLKLDELIRAVHSARTGLVDLEDLKEEELEKLQKEFAEMRMKAARMRKENKNRNEDPPIHNQNGNT